MPGPVRITFIIGLVPAKTARDLKKRGTIVPPPPVDLLGPQHGLGVVPFKRDALRVHRGQRISSPTFRAAVLSNFARWQHPGVTLDSNGTLFGAPSATGSFSFTVSVLDGNACAGQRDYEIEVPCPAITISRA